MNTAKERFEVGTELSVRSMCDSDSVFTWTVIARTAKTVTLSNRYNETTRRTIKTDRNGGEYCLPLGSYSMAPVLRASEVVR